MVSILDPRVAQPPAPTPAVDVGAMEMEFKRKQEDMRLFRRDSVVVVNNVPKIGPEMYEKLVSKFTPLFERAGVLRKGKDGGIRLLFPKSSEGGSLGFAFAEYENPEQARRAVHALDGKKIDRKHTFWARIAPDFQRLQHCPDVFVPPQPLPVASPDQPNYRSWLLDNRGRDMFLCRSSDTVSVMWNDHVIKPSVDKSQRGWSEGHTTWSPKGTYLATTHGRGVKLWGRVPPPEPEEPGMSVDVEWQVVRRFEHANVQLMDFSPCENYLVTFNGIPPDQDNKRDPQCIRIFDIRTGKLKRSFLGPHPIPNQPAPWPVFQWSHDDKYFARRNEGSISVYQTPDMGLLDKKSIKLPLVQHFTWSPTDNTMAYWVPESENSPARVTLIELPSRRELRQKALYSVAGIRMHWHHQGTFLCCKVDRLTKSKKGQFTNFELFRVKAKDIPVEVLEYKEKDIVQYFAWEPHGYRFGVIHSYRDNPSRSDVSFYSMGGVAGELKLVKTLEKKSANQLCWSPKGRFILLAAVATQNGLLEFYDANDLVKAEPEPIGQNEHFLCNEVMWDPSGRFAATVVSYWRNRSDNGYKIWSMYGKELAKGEIDMLYQFMWRPRPKSLLSTKQEKDVRKKLKARRERYEKEDKDLRDTVSSGRAAQRRRLRDDYAAYRARVIAQVQEEQEKRRNALGAYGEMEEEGEKTIEETKEVVVSVKEETTTTKLLSAEDERD